MPKVNDKMTILKEARGKQLVMYKGNPKGISSFFSRNLLASKEWHDIVKIMKGNKTFNQENSSWQDYHSEQEREGIFQIIKS